MPTLKSTARIQSTRLSPVLVLAMLVMLSGASGAAAWAIGSYGGTLGSAEPGEITASVSAAPRAAGTTGQANGSVTGLPLPRFVSLKADKVNVRRGPSSGHPVAFMFQRKGLPVEITAEFENWRKIRDSDGAEGWILQSMLSGRRTAYVAQWSKGKMLDLHIAPEERSGVSARLKPGVLASISACDGHWCEISSDGHDGFAEQERLWGVYPGEVLD